MKFIFFAMKGLFATLLLLCLLILAFWSGQTEKQLLGNWKMVRILEGTEDLSARLNPKNDRWIRFREDLRFESGGSPYGRNGGTYTFAPDQMVLSLDSDAGEGDDSQWRVRFRQDSMVWQGIGSERQEKTQVLHIRVAD